MHTRRRLSVAMLSAALVGFGAAPASAQLRVRTRPPESGDVDLSLFYQRLEDLGMRTDQLRRVAARIKIYFEGKVIGQTLLRTEATYLLPYGSIFLDRGMMDGEAHRIRYDATPKDLNSVLHEFSHAELHKLVPREGEPVLRTPEGEHRIAHEEIQADLEAEGQPRTEVRADEVKGEYMGSVVQNIFEAAEQVIRCNLEGPCRGLASGDRLAMVPETPVNRIYFSGGYWNDFVGSSCGGATEWRLIGGHLLIDWKPRREVKERMFRWILDLNPPANMQEIVERLNDEGRTSPQLEELRARLRAARSATVVPAGSPAGSGDDRILGQKLRN